MMMEVILFPRKTVERLTRAKLSDQNSHKLVVKRMFSCKLYLFIYRMERERRNQSSNLNRHSIYSLTLVW